MFMRSHMPASHRQQVVEYIDNNWTLHHQAEHYRNEADRTRIAMRRLRTELNTAQVAFHKASLKARLLEEKVNRLMLELDSTAGDHADAVVMLDRSLYQIKQEYDAQKVA